jgi:hypothetical protein
VVAAFAERAHEPGAATLAVVVACAIAAGPAEAPVGARIDALAVAVDAPVVATLLTLTGLWYAAFSDWASDTQTRIFFAITTHGLADLAGHAARDYAQTRRHDAVAALGITNFWQQRARRSAQVRDALAIAAALARLAVDCAAALDALTITASLVSVALTLGARVGLATELFVDHHAALARGTLELWQETT